MSITIPELRFPVPGGPVTRGSRVRIAVPQLVGMSKDDAIRSIQDLGLVEDVETVVTIGTEDQVFEQRPERGARVTPGSTIVIGVVRNPAPSPKVGERLARIDDNLARLTEQVDTIRTLAERIDQAVTGGSSGADDKDESTGGKAEGPPRAGSPAKAASSGGAAGAS